MQQTGTRSEPTFQPRAGARLGRNLLIAPLGAGGDGRVWTAERQSELGFRKRVAIKLLGSELSNDPKARKRFEREVRMTARAEHPNVRGIYAASEQSGCPYMVLRWAHSSLEELLFASEGRRLSPEAVALIGLDGCAALSAVHGNAAGSAPSRPMVHADLSPDNLLLTRSGGVWLADFALARPLDEVLPADAAFRGKPGYAAPELLRGQPPSVRSDLFALGCVLYEALSGRPPYGTGDERAIAFRVLEGPPRPLADGYAQPARALSEVVSLALATDPERRVATASELAERISATLGGTLRFQAERALRQSIEQWLGPTLDDRELELRRLAERATPTPTTATLPHLPRTRSTTKPDPRPASYDSRAAQRRTPPTRRLRHPARITTLARSLAIAGLALAGLALAGRALLRQTTQEERSPLVAAPPGEHRAEPGERAEVEARRSHPTALHAAPSTEPAIAVQRLSASARAPREAPPSYGAPSAPAANALPKPTLEKAATESPASPIGSSPGPRPSVRRIDRSNPYAPGPCADAGSGCSAGRVGLGGPSPKVDSTSTPESAP